MAPKEIAEAVDGEGVTVTGTLSAVIGSGRREEPMAVAVLTCPDGSVRAEVWPLAFLLYGHLVTEGAEVTVRGTVDRRHALVLRVDHIAAVTAPDRAIAPAVADDPRAPTQRRRDRLKPTAELARIVKELGDTRRSNHISLEAVARHVGVSYQAVAAWESGRSLPTPESLNAWKTAVEAWTTAAEGGGSRVE